MDSLGDSEWSGDKNANDMALTNSFVKLNLSKGDLQNGEGNDTKELKDEEGREKFVEDEQDGDGDGLILLDDNGQQLCSLSEPTEFDKVVAAIEDTMIEQPLGELQLGCVEMFHRLMAEPSDSDVTAKKNKIFQDYRAKMCAALEVGVKKIAQDFDMAEFLDEIFSTPFEPPMSHNKEFEESEIYELLQTMYDLEGFETLVNDYVDLVKSRDVLSAVKVTPFRFENHES